MKKYLLSLLAVTLITTVSFAQSQRQTQGQITWNSKTFGFYQYLPENYINETKTYPCIIFLHGVGQMGYGGTDTDQMKEQLKKVLDDGIPKLIAQNTTSMTFKNPQGVLETFIVLSPQYRPDDGSWQTFYIDAMLDHASRLRVDRNRIYLTGLSMGGGGTWKYAYTSLENAKKFAAIAPIASTREVQYSESILCPTIAAAKTAVWAFHNRGDGGATELWNTESPCNVLSRCPDYNTSNDPRLVKTIYEDGGHDAWTKAYNVTNSVHTPNLYEWFLRFSRSDAITANAGGDQSINAPNSTVQLKGFATVPSGVTVRSYLWSKVSGPGQFKIVSDSTAETEVNNLTVGEYVFRLTITGSDGSTARDDVKVTVLNQSPIAKAGLDQTTTAREVTVNGSGSSDPDGSIATYEWTKSTGPVSFNITNPNAVSTTITNLEPGTYIFKLKVTDNLGASETDDVQITISSSTNAFQAKAGNDFIVQLPYSGFLQGNGSTAPSGGSIASYSWSKTAGPTQYYMVSPNESGTFINNLVVGAYTFQLKVTANDGQISTDDVTVTVLADNFPTANAGKDINVNLPSSVYMDGSGSIAPKTGGTISSYQWSKIAGPGQYNMVSPNAQGTWLNSLVAGVYTFRLKVTASNGNSATDDVQITVTGPVARAGNDISIYVPASSTTLDGSASTNSGGTLSYLWSKIQGPSSANIKNPGDAITLVEGLIAGKYKFQLQVTSGGATSKDTIDVTVHSNLPQAYAGENITVQLPNSGYLMGEGSSAPPSSTITYLWTKISGPSQYFIVAPNSMNTHINNLAAGTYVFRLTLQDQYGNASSDDVEVTVVAATTSSNRMGSNMPVAETVAARLMIKTYPNPVVNNLNYSIEGKINGPAEIYIIDMKGRIIKRSTIIKDQAKLSGTIAVNDLVTGVYTIQFTFKNVKERVTMSFVK